MQGTMRPLRDKMAERQLRPSTAVVLLLAVVALGAALRFYGLGSGLPHVVGPDEGFEIHRALKLGAGEIDLERTAKGGFFYLLFLEYGAYFVWLRLTGAITGAQEFAESFALDITPFWMIARVTHVATALLLVLATYSVGRRAYGRLPGLVAAAATSFSVLLVSHSQYVGVDLPMTLLAVVCFGFVLEHARGDRAARPVIVGLLLGAATMTKLPGVVLVVPIAIAELARRRALPKSGHSSVRVLGVTSVVALAVFAIGNPGFVLAFPDFLDKILGVLSGGPGATEEVYRAAGSGTNLWLFYGRALRSALGTALFGLSLFGVFWAIAVRRTTDLLILAFVVPFYVLIAGAQTSHLFYPRYVIPLVPFLALLAGRALGALLDLAPFGRTGRSAAMALCAGLLLAPLIVDSVRWSSTRGREDSRVYARRWMEANVPAESSVFLLGNPVVDTAPNLSLPLRASAANLERLAEELRNEGSPAKAQVLELRNRRGVGRPFDLHTARHFDELAPLEVWERAGVEYFALLREDFEHEALRRDAKHPRPVLDSRLRLYEGLLESGRAERVFSADPNADGLQGPAIEIFRLLPVEPASAVGEGGVG